jgi:hypothetical protein
VTQGGRGKKLSGGLEEVINFGSKTISNLGLDVFVGKIDPRFDAGEKIQESFSVGHEMVTKFPGESPLSGKQGALRAGVKHIEDSFRTG